MATTLSVVFSILPFGNHVKKFGSNFKQDFNFLSKSNLKCLFVYDKNVLQFNCLMHVLMSLGHKDFTIIITGHEFF